MFRDLLVDSAANMSGYLQVVFAMMGKFTDTRSLNLTIFPEGRDIRDIIGHVHRVVLQFSHKKGFLPQNIWSNWTAFPPDSNR